MSTVSFINPYITIPIDRSLNRYQIVGGINNNSASNVVTGLGQIPVTDPSYLPCSNNTIPSPLLFNNVYQLSSIDSFVQVGPLAGNSQNTPPKIGTSNATFFISNSTLYTTGNSLYHVNGLNSTCGTPTPVTVAYLADDVIPNFTQIFTNPVSIISAALSPNQNGFYLAGRTDLTALGGNIDTDGTKNIYTFIPFTYPIKKIDLVTNNSSLGYSTIWCLDTSGRLFVGGSSGNAYKCGLGSTSSAADLNVSGLRREYTNGTWDDISGCVSHVAALSTNGALFTCGTNGSGQLGLGNTTSVSTLTQEALSGTWSKAIAGGGINITTYNNTFAISSNGALFGCGTNGSGQLGLGNTTSVSTLTQEALSGTWKDVVNSSGATMALSSNGALFGCGLNSSGQLGPGSTLSPVTKLTQETLSGTWSKVACGLNFTLALSSNGALFGCGANGSGQLGLGNTTSVSTLTREALSGTWKDIRVGSNIVFALSSNNIWFFAGSNVSQTAGYGTSTSSTDDVASAVQNYNKFTPLYIQNYTPILNPQFKSFDSSTNFGIVALSTNGAAFYSRLNKDYNSNIKNISIGVPALSYLTHNNNDTRKWLDMKIGGTTSSTQNLIGLDTNNRIFSIGFNQSGMFGVNNSSTDGFIYKNWVQEALSGNWQKIATDNLVATLYALSSNGALFGCGTNANYQLGLKTNTSPIRILTQEALSGTWNDISVYNTTLHALSSNGALFGCGINANYQVGLATNTTPITGLTQEALSGKWSKICTGYDYLVALSSNGALFGCGLNFNNMFNIPGAPTPIQTLTRESTNSFFSDVIVNFGSDSILAKKLDNTLYGTGFISVNGTCASNSTNQYRTALSAFAPVVTPGLTLLNSSSKFNSLYRGNFFTIAISGTTAYIAGDNGSTYYGINALSAYPLIGISANKLLKIPGNWKKIIGTVGTADPTYPGNKSYTTSLYALSTNGKLFTAGDNQYGQLGLGSSAPNTVPTFTQEALSGTWIDITAGGYVTSPANSYPHLIALSANNTLFGCGSNYNGQLGLNQDFSSSSKVYTLTQEALSGKWQSAYAGDIFGATAALSSNNTLFLCGLNTNGRLGLGPSYSSVNTLTAFTQEALSGKWNKVVLGDTGYAALSTNNKLFTCYTNNYYGTALNGSFDSSNTALTANPVLTQEPTNGSFVDIVQVDSTIWCALSTSGDLFAAGLYYGRGGIPNFSYPQSPLLTNVATLDSLSAFGTLIPQSQALLSYRKALVYASR